MPDIALAPGLYIAATPIGHLGDVTDRLRQVLTQADRVLCEDTRATGKLLAALGLRAKALTPYHDHNGAAARPVILDALANGEAIALVSDAGTPLIADPGYKLVKEARAHGHAIFAVPGPCAAIAALSIAGVPTDRFSFQGFLPPKSAARQRRLATLRGRDETLIFYETGPRLAATLSDMVTTLGDGPVQIARELTKLHEETVDGHLSALAAQYHDTPPKGEIVIILPPQAAAPMTLEDADPLMQTALATMSLKDASAHVAAETGLKKRDLYQRWRDGSA